MTMKMVDIVITPTPSPRHARALAVEDGVFAPDTPRIHHLSQKLDCRIKSGNDEGNGGAVITPTSSPHHARALVVEDSVFAPDDPRIHLSS